MCASANNNHALELGNSAVYVLVFNWKGENIDDSGDGLLLLRRDSLELVDCKGGHNGCMHWLHMRDQGWSCGRLDPKP